MTLRDLLRESVDVDNQDVWENERTATPVRCFAVRLHSVGLSVREVEGVRDYRPNQTLDDPIFAGEVLS